MKKKEEQKKKKKKQQQKTVFNGYLIMEVVAEEVPFSANCPGEHRRVMNIITKINK